MTTRPIAIATALAALCLTSACGDDDDGPLGNIGTQQFATVRVVNLAPETASLALFAGTSSVVSDVGFGTTGSCVQVPIGRSLSARATGSSTQLASISTPGLSRDARYTVIVHGSGTSTQMTLLSDADTPTPAVGSQAVRFFNATGSAIDIFVTEPDAALGPTPDVANLAAGQATTGASAFTTLPVNSTFVRAFDVGSTLEPRVEFTINPGSLSSARTGTVVLSEETLIGGANATLVVTPCS